MVRCAMRVEAVVCDWMDERKKSMRQKQQPIRGGKMLTPDWFGVKWWEGQEL